MKESLKELQKIPGIGKKISKDLYNIGIHTVSELKGQNPEELYEKLCLYQGQKVDRCVLYVLRCAVYFANEKNHEPEKLKWWNWKDGNKK